jgi:nicotinate-nucleotide--dimethylbenzimidazole phosphoribosyltransferase
MKLAEVLGSIKAIDTDVYEKAVERTSNLVMPPRAMGRINDISEQLCSITRTLKPQVDKKAVFVMAGDHGIASKGVSAFPQEVTGQMMSAFLGGLATINALSKTAGAKVFVTDSGTLHNVSDTLISDSAEFFQRKVASGTADFSEGPAMTKEQAEACIMVGFEVTSEQIKKHGLNMIATGDMGIANTTPSSAIGAVFTGESVEVMTGKGSGVSGSALEAKVRLIKQGIEINKPDKYNGLDVLAKVGGFEIGAIAGTILAAAYYKIPVVVDGIISTAGAMIASSICPASHGYMIAGHTSAEPGHKIMLTYLNLEPVLNLGMRLGEGTGAVAAMQVVELAASVIRDIATFEEAGVSGKSDD